MEMEYRYRLRRALNAFVVSPQTSTSLAEGDWINLTSVIPELVEGESDIESDLWSITLPLDPSQSRLFIRLLVQPVGAVD